MTVRSCSGAKQEVKLAHDDCGNAGISKGAAAAAAAAAPLRYTFFSRTAGSPLAQATTTSRTCITQTRHHQNSATRPPAVVTVRTASDDRPAMPPSGPLSSTMLLFQLWCAMCGSFRKEEIRQKADALDRSNDRPVAGNLLAACSMLALRRVS